MNLFRWLVQREARVLDAAVPGWEERIDVDLLDMQRCKRCVLGQIFGDYRSGNVRYAGIQRRRWAYRSSFAQDHWVDAIRARREAAAATLVVPVEWVEKKDEPVSV
jgi:hypothetical protein